MVVVRTTEVVVRRITSRSSSEMVVGIKDDDYCKWMCKMLKLNQCFKQIVPGLDCDCHTLLSVASLHLTVFIN